VLVTEPTPFGLHDLKLAIEMVKKLKVRPAVFINKSSLPGPDIEEFCNAHGIPVLGRLPLDRRIAELYSRGELLAEHGLYADIFQDLRDRVMSEVRR
jgi:MinD superfamily P-loop ATPase